MFSTNCKPPRQQFPGIIGGGVAMIGAARGPGRLRNEPKIDAEIAAALPAGKARDDMMAHLELKVARLRQYDAELTRDWSGFVLGVVGVFIYGAVESAGKAKRNDAGNRIKDDSGG